MLLKIEDLHVEIAGKEIVKGLNLEVKEGETHAIMGPNGSGKSTLAQVVAELGDLGFQFGLALPELGLTHALLFHLPLQLFLPALGFLEFALRGLRAAAGSDRGLAGQPGTVGEAAIDDIKNKGAAMKPFAYDLDEQDLKRERQKARDLRQSQWWKRRCAKGVCHWCGESVPAKELTMDHIVPVSRGGKSTKGNVAPCCKECNNAKKQLLPMEWEQYLKQFNEDA